MAENELGSQETQQLRCSSCGAVIAPEDVREGHARQVGGEMLCASCVDAHTKAEAIKCRKCGAHEPPMFDGKNYLCRVCGAALKNEKRVAAVGGEGGKVPVQLCPYCNEVVGLGARRCAACGARLIGSLRPSGQLQLREYLIGAAAAAAIFVVAILMMRDNGAAEERLDNKLAQVDKRLDLAIKSHGDAMKSYKEEMSNLAVQAIAKETFFLQRRLNELEKRAVTAVPPAENKDDPLTLDTILADRTEVEDDTPPVKPPVEPVDDAPPDHDVTPPREPIDETAPPDEDPAVEKTDAAQDIDSIIAKITAEAKRLATESRFGEAIDMLDSRPDVRDPIWQADREVLRGKIRTVAKEFHAVDLTRAKRLVGQGRIEDARKVYQEIAKYGLPKMIKDAETSAAALAGLPDKPPEPETTITHAPPLEPPPEPDTPLADADPRVAKHVAQLSDREAALHVRTGAAKKLGELRSPQAVDALIATMDDRDWYLRVCAANSLEQIGDVRAVPALINNLKHTMIPVSQTARKALVTLTGKDFKDAGKWAEWWNTEGLAKLSDDDREKLKDTEPVKVIEIADEPTSFASQIVVFKEDQQSVTFTVDANSGLTVGQKINLKRDDLTVAMAEIAVLGFGTATADLLNIAEDATLKAGDMVTVEK